ncbi:ABC transporter substrate-binding protein [Paeniglutamicibacter kerguelensis]|uniref:Polar amino acid transport system substrate-binding protein n=1 Tax=Paeniglutamicibacter kerguelensis TaxID=254788 RepID=A0ABS4XEY1_9MICC|nr:ABC transporter substrate-binding protein [Paeniglutamicibacter kerguelensis]MBP2387014.1 polar amino acid transport system substrate-binding protein [Paeniglutamicibacter kerguelensis]
MRITTTVLKSLAVAAVGALALTACGSNDTPAASTSADPNAVKLLNPGKFTVCSDIPYEPFEFVKDGKNVGFDMDIAAEIAKDLGVELNVITSPFESIQSGLFKTQCDAAISGLSITEERKGNMDFSTPYMDDDLTLVAKEGSGITSVESAKGQKVGVQQATTGAKFAKEHGLVPVEYATGNDQVMSLKSGQTVASLGNQSILGYAIKNEPTLKRVEDFKSGEQLGIAVAKGNTVLLEKINATLKRITDDGTMKTFSDTWFGTTN